MVSRYASLVVATDHTEAIIELLKENRSRNRHLPVEKLAIVFKEAKLCRLEVDSLEWGKKYAQEFKLKHNLQFDIVIASEVLQISASVYLFSFSSGSLHDCKRGSFARDCF